MRIKLTDSLTKLCAVIYTDNDIQRLIDYAQKHSYKYYYIKHNADEEHKKEHYHLIIESDSKHRFKIKSLITDSTPINLFEKCNNVGAYLRYMTHCDYDDKEHYSVDDIHSNVALNMIKNKFVL